MTTPYIFIYDAKCGLCRGFRDWLMESAPPDLFVTMDFADPRVPSLLPGIARDKIVESAHVIMPDGRVLSGHAAIRLAFGSTRWGRWTAPILELRVLDPIMRVIYTWIAKNRYRISCRIKD